jgi:RsiW-degrading membrane proteinase PrsW (M82 family)
MTSAYTFFLICLGGFLPALLWLWFWLREDKLHPEPRGMIMLTFFAGVLSILPVYIAEVYVQDKLMEPGIKAWLIAMQGVIPIFAGLFAFETIRTILWASVEEIIKFMSTALSGLRSKVYDEPIDALVYLISGGLGFSAAENSFFLYKVLQDEGVLKSMTTGNMRFIGASLLHVLTAGIIGSCLAITFYKRPAIRRLSVVVGLLIATVLHTFFNLYIIESEGSGIFTVFCILWLAIILLLVVFEKVKKLTRSNK